MKMFHVVSLIALVPLCAQATRQSSSLQIFFHFNSPAVPALHNQINAISVQEGDTFAHAVAKLKKQVRIPAGYNLSFMTYDLMSIPVNQWPTIDIIRDERGAKLTGFAFGLVGEDTPISVSLQPN